MADYKGWRNAFTAGGQAGIRVCRDEAAVAVLVHLAEREGPLVKRDGYCVGKSGDERFKVEAAWSVSDMERRVEDFRRGCQLCVYELELWLPRTIEWSSNHSPAINMHGFYTNSVRLLELWSHIGFRNEKV
ncbi:hypothetical protein FIBSPDRAFT_902297 [Athelia psychrophila]|uniref:Uncharacterized protein n=1 Tax=Athelia psychrophila TaxID=1759441 RepID=A0A167XDQ3_9AGAM|nr:hypothetical protein FIBSPDRAFT_902297 [Fibularhizoctonia sp. CBS 109695]